SKKRDQCEKANGSPFDAEPTWVGADKPGECHVPSPPDRQYEIGDRATDDLLWVGVNADAAVKNSLFSREIPTEQDTCRPVKVKQVGEVTKCPKEKPVIGGRSRTPQDVKAEGKGKKDRGDPNRKNDA